ncbi:MAG: hypothetical protein D6767_03380 [Candidatus Hydrogenedentota bacterium]|nr:MAG: hypothetical protein D6767_03380 [Candidatus Hydrogenedentota bacterium]
MKRLAFLISLTLFLAECKKAPIQRVVPKEECIKVATFNIQIFGKKKVQNSNLRTAIAEIVSRFDLTAIQELRDKSRKTMKKLKETLLSRGFPAAYVASDRVGISRVKEQMVFLFNREKLRLRKDRLWSNPGNSYSRPPYEAFFFTKYNHTFSALTIHTRPSEAETEIRTLSEQIKVENKPDLLTGDWNADCSYFNRNLLPQFFPDYDWSFPNPPDSTVGKTTCLYDQLALKKRSRWYFRKKPRVFRFDWIADKYGFARKKISDHYPVYATVCYINS